MTREDVERLMHCARTEGLGAGPNTLAEVCEWALEASNGSGFWGRAAARNGQRLERARDVLRWLNRRGGLGLDVHNRIDAALSDEESSDV